MHRTVTFALAGSGVAAKLHARAIAQTEHARLCAVYDVNAARAEQFAAEAKAENLAEEIRAVASFEDLLADEGVDVLCLCTPSGLHAGQAVSALRAGKHVLVEKPLALTPADCDLVIQAAKESGKTCAVVSQLRFAPAIAAVKKAADEGHFGKIVSGEISMLYHRPSSYYEGSSWRGTWAMDGGGALINQGIHGVDMLLYWMGRVESVAAFCRTLAHPIETEDTAAAVVSFAGGAVGTIQAATSPAPGYPRRFALYGTKGSVLLEEDHVLRWDLAVPPPNLPGGSQGGHKNPAAISVSGHQRHMEEMVRAVLTGAPVMLDAREGKRAVELIHAIYESAQTGRVMTV